MCHPGLDRVTGLHHLHVVGRKDLQQHRRLTIHGGEDFLIFIAVHHPRHITHGDSTTGRQLANHNPAEVVLIICQVARPQPHITGLGANLAGRQVNGAGPNGSCHLGKPQSILPHGGFRQLNSHFFAAAAKQFHQGYIRQLGYFITHILGQAGQGLFTHIAMHGNPHHFAAVLHPRNARLLDIPRQAVDSIHSIFDIIEERFQILRWQGVHFNPGHALSGGGVVAIDTVEAVQRCFKADHNLFFDLLRGSTGPDHFYDHLVRLKHGEGFTLHGDKTQQTGQQNAQHQQVGGNRIGCPPGNGVTHG